MLPQITGEFRVGSDPELRFSPSGVAVCKVRLVATKRKQNPNTNEWEDANTCWVYATGFKTTAENMAECIKSGMLVVVDGQLEVQEWTDNNNVKRTTPNILLNSIGPSLSRDYANVVRRENAGQGAQQGGGGAQPQQNGQQAASGAPASDEPPF